MIDRPLRRLRPLTLGVGLAIIGCGGPASQALPGRAPEFVVRHVMLAPAASSKSKTVTLAGAGGTVSVPSFDGFTGTLPYAKNNAPKGTTLKLTNDGAHNGAGLPAPPQGKAILFLAVSVSAKGNVTFKADASLHGTLKSSALKSTDTYSLRLYVNKKQSGSAIKATFKSKGTLQFATPLAKRSIGAKTPLSIELVDVSPPPPPLTVKPSSLKFTSAKSQTFTAAEDGYTGKFTVTNTCASIAKVTPASGQGPSTKFTVTPIGGGKCQITVADSNKQSALAAVAVTSGIIKINTKERKS